MAHARGSFHRRTDRAHRLLASKARSRPLIREIYVRRTRIPCSPPSPRNAFNRFRDDS